MKTEMIEFDTQKTVQQIADALRSVRCEMVKLQDDPLAGVGGSQQAVIAVGMTGQAGFMDAFKHFGAGKSEWGVQVFVYELGNKRHCELVALGESGMKAAFKAYGATGGRLSNGYSAMANQYFNIRHSRDHRDQIAQMLA